MLHLLNEKIYFGNTLRDYAIALGVFIGVIILITIIQKIIISRINKHFPDTEQISLSDILHSFKRRLLPITYTIAIYSALNILKVPKAVLGAIDKVIIVVISVFVILFITDCIRIISQTRKDSAKIPMGMVSLFQAIVWILGVLFIFANLGYNVSTFITGLGIGGVAIALASQAILGDLFNYFVIILDKPFQKGDAIQIDSLQGTVEYIGVKGTRIRSITGEQLLVSNTDLTKARLQNFKNMVKRRKLTTIGVEYSTSPEKLKQIPKILEDIIKNNKNTELSRVHFAEFGASSLNFELAYYVLSSEYKNYIDTVQEINFAIYDALNQLGVSMAFPSQTIYISKTGDN